MGKYAPLARYLKSRDGDTWSATFGQIKETLGFELPRSAHKHRAWWANQKDGNHSQTAGWQSAGWETEEADFKHSVVRCARRARRPDWPVASSGVSNSPDISALWAKASNLTGIADRGKLEEAALLALIHREASRQLAALGGTMPDYEVPPRKRPDW